MAEGIIEMSERERRRMVELERVERREKTLAQAGEAMGVSYRHAKRLYAAYRQRGASALAHKGRGRRGNRRIGEELRERALALVGEHYADFGPTLAAEQLAERHEMKVDHETLRRWMIKAGIWQTRHGERKHRRKRQRRSAFGELVQIDGSHHDWFEGRAAPCCLMVMIDDATGVVRAWFAAGETSEAGMRLVWAWIEEFGVPRALYADRNNIYVTPSDGGGDRALIKACEALDIEIIAAGSPQAKGRVERVNGTLQDRLIKMMRLEKIDSIEAANEFLKEWMPSHSERFEVEPTRAASAHRVAEGLELGAIFAWHDERKVNNDFTIRFKNGWYQLGADAPGPGATVTVRRRLDGRMEILDGGRALEYRRVTEPPPRHVDSPPAVASDAGKGASKARKPAPDHPWRKPMKSQKTGMCDSGSIDKPGGA